MFGLRLFEGSWREALATVRVVRYVLQNPMRAERATHPRAYPFIGSQVYSVDELLDAIADVQST